MMKNVLVIDEFVFVTTTTTTTTTTTQDLSLTLSSERTTAELELNEDDEELSGINVSAFGNEQEWQLHNHVETRRRLVTRTYDTDESTHPMLSTSCRASRRPGFFVWNIFLVMVSGGRSARKRGASR
jgi:hypothetical protein